MFITLLLATFLLAFVVSFVIVRVFHTSLDRILKRIIPEEISTAWLRYLQFAAYVVGVSSGVRVYQIERYLAGTGDPERAALVLDGDRWTLEIFRTIIETLQGIAWMLLVFFVFALIAFVIVRIFEMRKAHS
jgi:hypothetical protein